MRTSPVVNTWLVQPLEKALSTGLELFGTLLLATGSASILGGQLWLHSLDYAGFAALVSLVMAYLAIAVVLQGWADILYRTAKTFVATFVGVLVVGPVLNLSGADWKAGLAAAIPAALAALLKSMVGTLNPSTLGGSWARHIDPVPTAA